MTFPTNILLDLSIHITAFKQKLSPLFMPDYEIDDLLLRLMTSLSYKTIAKGQMFDCIAEISEEYYPQIGQDKVMFLATQLHLLGDIIFKHLCSSCLYVNGEYFPYHFQALHGNNVIIEYDHPEYEEVRF